MNYTDLSPSSPPKLLKCQSEIVKHEDGGGLEPAVLLPATATILGQPTPRAQRVYSDPYPAVTRVTTGPGAPGDPTQESCPELRQRELARLGLTPSRSVPTCLVARTPGSPCPGRIRLAETDP